MGLSASLSNALSGMTGSQNSLTVLSRNVSNAGTPGYHKQSVSIVDTMGANSPYARMGGVTRAFDRSLQAYYTSANSNSGFTGTTTAILNRLQTFVGKPGDPGSLDSVFLTFQNSLLALGTSPDNYATRSTVLSQAQSIATTLNSLASDVQGLRQETEVQMGSMVDQLNRSLTSLADINGQLGDNTADRATRATLLDQRDRLVTDIADMIDVRVDYRNDDTVALMTRTGVGLLDVQPSVFRFQSAGTLSADKLFNGNPGQSGVGQLTLTSPSGLSLDLVQQNVVQSGKLGALIELRDKTLPIAQGQLDEIAAALAQSMSTVQTAGVAASSGAQNGLSVDLSKIRDGNDFVLNYSKGGVEKSLRVVRVDDATKLPLDYVDAKGTRVVGMSFAGGAAGIALALPNLLGAGFTSSGVGNTLTVLDDGAASTTDVDTLTAHATATGLQNGDLALNLFVDLNDADFTNSLSGKPQKQGFASRITVNSAVRTDSTLLVQYAPGSSLGDAARADQMLNQLQSMTFATSQTSHSDPGTFRLSGKVTDLIAQTMDYTGSVAGAATSDDDTQQLVMESISQRLDAQYGVNVDEEMARLLELQNAYAANARVISTVQQLMQQLMDL